MTKKIYTHKTRDINEFVAAVETVVSMRVAADNMTLEQQAWHCNALLSPTKDSVHQQNIRATKSHKGSAA